MSTAISREIALARAVLVLRAAGIQRARLDAELLLCHVLGVSRTALVTHLEAPLSAESDVAYQDLIHRRAAREPLPYILGKHPFLDLLLHVEPGVLIPRPETELLVDVAAAYLTESFANPHSFGPGAPLKAMDIGTGSGAIAIGLALRAPGLEVVATDLSDAALAVAQQNVDAYLLGSRVWLVRADLFPDCDSVSSTTTSSQPDLGDLDAALTKVPPVDVSIESWKGQVNVIVSNPPYIPGDEIDGLQPEVALFEPRLALDGGADGLQIIRRLIRDAVPWLCSGGILLFEVGSGQAPAALDLLREVGYVNCRSFPDLAGIERVALGQWKEG